MSRDHQYQQQTSLHHSANEEHDPLPTIFTPRRRTGKAPSQAVSRTEDGQTNAAKDGHRCTSEYVTHTPSRIPPYTNGQSGITTNVSAARRRRRLIPTSHEEAQIQEEPLQDERFERMLALLDDDGSVDTGSGAHHHHHSSTRNDESRGSGSGSVQGQSPRRRHQLTLRTPSPSSSPTRSPRYTLRSPDAVQHASSFEALRQIVSSTSPHSRPRRRRMDLKPPQEQEAVAEKGNIAGVDAVDSDYRKARRDQRRTGGAGTHQVRDHDQATSSSGEQSVFSSRLDLATTDIAQRAQTEDNTGRPRQASVTLRYAMQPSPPSTSRTGKLEPPLHSSFQADNNRYANEMKVSPCRHHLRRRLSPTATPVEHTPERYRTRHSHISDNSSDDEEGRAEDVLDTAPPSDLDARFPALSPQPSPLNSRRRHTREFDQTPRIESASFAAGRRERDQTRANEDVFASGSQPRYDIHSLSFAEESQEDNSQWNATQDLVNSFLPTRKQPKQNPKARGDQQANTDLESGRMSPDLTQRFHRGYRENGSTGTRHSDMAVLQRLDTVTDEVHALRNQVADLATLVSRALVAGSNPRTADDQGTERLPNTNQVDSLLLFLDSLVHNRVGTAGTMPEDDPGSSSDVLRVCETRNLEFIRERVTEWEGVVRERGGTEGLATRKGSR